MQAGPPLASLSSQLQTVMRITTQPPFRAWLVQPSVADVVGQAIEIERGDVDGVLLGGLDFLDEVATALRA